MIPLNNIDENKVREIIELFEAQIRQSKPNTIGLLYICGGHPFNFIKKLGFRAGIKTKAIGSVLPFPFSLLRFFPSFFGVFELSSNIELNTVFREACSASICCLFILDDKLSADVLSMIKSRKRLDSIIDKIGQNNRSQAFVLDSDNLNSPSGMAGFLMSHQ